MMFEDFALSPCSIGKCGDRAERDRSRLDHLHPRFFQDLVEDLRHARNAHFMQQETVRGHLRGGLGLQAEGLDFYTAYAALRHGIVMFRITRRSIRFGEAVMPRL